LLVKGIVVGFWFFDNVKFDFIPAKGFENFLTSYGVNKFVKKTKDNDK
jgi:hypothetical protein